DLLNYADVQQLSKISHHYECECNPHSKHEMIQSILQAMNRRGVFEQMVSSMKIEDLRFIHTLLFDDHQGYSLEELTARVRQTGFDRKQNEPLNPRETIMQFKRRGWLFNGYAHHTKYLFHIPDDIKRKL